MIYVAAVIVLAYVAVAVLAFALCRVAAEGDRQTVYECKNFTTREEAVHSPASVTEGVHRIAAPVPPAEGDRSPGAGLNGGRCGRSSPPAGGSRAKAGVAPASSPGLDFGEHP